MFLRFVAASAVLVGLLAAVGCGGKNVAALRGKVTLDGTPVANGSIVFLPLGSQGTKAASAIEDGNYSIPSEAGLKPGKYLVEVTWQKPTGRKIPSADPGIAMDETKEAIPAKYNVDSTLTAEITAGESQKDFVLSTN